MERDTLEPSARVSAIGVAVPWLCSTNHWVFIDLIHVKLSSMPNSWDSQCTEKEKMHIIFWVPQIIPHSAGFPRKSRTSFLIG